MNVVLILLGALVLLIGFKWGGVAIHNGSVERAQNPPLFWLVMTLAALLLCAGSYFLMTGK